MPESFEDHRRRRRQRCSKELRHGIQLGVATDCLAA
jgi:hypothetical protein